MNLTLTHFQIHKKHVVEIPEGETTYLEGDSDTGKSATLRAIRWLCENKPDGGSFVTFKTPRGTNSIVRFEVDGHVITRERGKSKNTYTLDGEVYEAFGRSVPEPILKVLNLSPYAFQLQGEAPFLIGSSPTEAAKILSEACGLGVIDTAVAYVRGKKTAVDADIRKSEILLESAERKLAETAAQLPLADALEQAGALGALAENMVEHIRMVSEAIEDEPQGEPLDLATAQEWTDTARRAWNDIQTKVSQLTAMRAALVAEPMGELFNLEGVAAAVLHTKALLDDCDRVMAHIPPMKQLLASEPQGVLFELESVRPLLGEAKITGEWLADVGRSAGQMRQLLADEPKGTTFDLEGVALLLIDCNTKEQDATVLRGMARAMRDAILSEPSGVLMDTTELMNQRAQIKVCPTCGREL